jgi:hypothetical protein
VSRRPTPAIEDAMTRRIGTLLDHLEALRDQNGPGPAREKLEALRALRSKRLSSPADVRRLHEALCFWRAYPDNPAFLRAVERELLRFGDRADVRRWRVGLLNSGIAGTDIVYAFNTWTAAWLAAKWPGALSVEWESVADEGRLLRLLFLLALPAEAPGLDEAPRPTPPWAAALAGSAGAAAFVIRRVAALALPQEVRVRLYDELDLPLRVSGGADTPSRTRARFEPAPVAYRAAPLRRPRPDLRAEALRPPEAIRPVAPREAERLIDLAHEAMVTRERDLDAFAWADARDVRMIECGEGLQFACIGVRPEKRFLLESVYGFLTLQSGVPIGYALASGLFESSEIAYNVFATFRGGEAAHVYGRFLAAARALFGCDTFEVPPYQLGDGNDEGLASGAWWFYYKLGLRPWARAVQSLVGREAGRVARDVAYRSPQAALKKLVRHPVFLSLGSRRADVLGWQRFDRVGLAVTDHVNGRFGMDRAEAERTLAEEAARLLGEDGWRRLPAGQRHAWLQWAPLVAVLPGVGGWPPSERRALARVIRAKGGRRESDFVPLFDAHARLRESVLTLARRSRPRPSSPRHERATDRR